MKKNKMKELYQKGIDSNLLKSIAIIAMVIDHVGYYFESFVPNEFYLVCRIIGRIAMPIFTYLLVQGFFHTKNYTKYIKRIIIFAVITQMLLSILMLINKKYFPEYYTTIYQKGNILFTFALSLVMLRIIHVKTIIKQWDYNKNMILKIFVGIAIIGTCMFVPLDYSIEVVMLTVLFYAIEKIKIIMYMKKSNNIMTMGGFLAKLISYEKIKIIYTCLILFSQVLINLYYDTSWYMLFSIIPIFLYNGEKGKSNKYTRKIFYVFFPLHHTLLYLTAMLIMLT